MDAAHAGGDRPPQVVSDAAGRLVQLHAESMPATEDDAELELRRLVEEDGGTSRPEAALLLGTLYRRTMPHKARWLFGIAEIESKRAITRVRALLRLAYLANDDEELGVAREYLASARELASTAQRESPNHLELVEARVDIASAFQFIEQTDDAIEMLQHLDDFVRSRLSEIDDHDDAWRETRAAIRLRTAWIFESRDIRLAERAYRDAIAWGTGPLSATAALHLGWLLEHRLAGLSPETEEMYRQAATLDDPVVAPQARIALGDMLHRSGLADLAEQEWKRACERGNATIRKRAGERLTGVWQAGAGQDRETLSVDAVAELSTPTVQLPVPTVSGRLAVGRAADKAESKRRRVIVVGAGTGGHYLLPGLRHDYEVVGVVDDSFPNVRDVYDVPVLGKISALQSLIAYDEIGIEQVIFAIPSANGDLRAKVLDAAHRCRVGVVTLPSMFELRLSHPMVPQLRPLEVFETFGSEPWHLDRAASSSVRGRRVAIVGAGTAIGRALARRAAHGHARHVHLIDSHYSPLKKVADELKHRRRFHDVSMEIVDYADQGALEHAFGGHQPEVVFSCAALPDHPADVLPRKQALRANVTATMAITAAAQKAGAADIVLASLDRAALRTTAFDWSRALGERVALAYRRRASPVAEHGLERLGQGGFRVSIVRLPEVWSRDGGVFARLVDQLEDGGPIAADPITRHRYIPNWDAAQAMLRTYRADHEGGIFAYERGVETDLAQVATRLAMVNGLVADRDIQIDRSTTGEKPVGITLLGAGEHHRRTLEGGLVEVVQDQRLIEELDARRHLAVRGSTEPLDPEFFTAAPGDELSTGI